MTRKKKIRPWKVHASKVLLEDHWIKLREDDCETESGARLSPFYVLEYPDWVSVTAVNDRNEILLVEQYRHGLGRVIFELPGGRMDVGDSAEETARRELVEETGCTCSGFEHLGSFAPNPSSHSNIEHFFLGRDCEKTHDTKFDPGEEINSCFVSIDKVLHLVDSGEFLHGRHISNILLALRHLGLYRAS